MQQLIPLPRATVTGEWLVKFGSIMLHRIGNQFTFIWASLSSGVQGPRHGGLPARRGTGANPEGQTNADSAVATCARPPSAIAVRLLAALFTHIRKI